MSPAPAVRCTSCHFAWNSAAMADGLRALGSCPKCSGGLAFAADEPRSERSERFERPPSSKRLAPHLVLGIPRRVGA